MTRICAGGGADQCTLTGRRPSNATIPESGIETMVPTDADAAMQANPPLRAAPFRSRVVKTVLHSRLLQPTRLAN